MWTVCRQKFSLSVRSSLSLAHLKKRFVTYSLPHKYSSSRAINLPIFLFLKRQIFHENWQMIENVLLWIYIHFVENIHIWKTLHVFNLFWRMSIRDRLLTKTLFSDVVIESICIEPFWRAIFVTFNSHCCLHRAGLSRLAIVISFRYCCIFWLTDYEIVASHIFWYSDLIVCDA